MKQTAIEISMINKEFNNTSDDEKTQEVRILANDEEVLDEADNILCEKLEELNRRSKYCYTAKEIGKEFGLDGSDMKSFLADRGVIRKVRGQWQLTKAFMHMGLTEKRYCYVYGHDGRRRLKSSLVWTEQGRDFIRAMIYD